MNKKLLLDPAWIIFFMVASTLIALKFINDEQTSNLVAGIALGVTFILFFSAVLLRGLTNRTG